MEVADADAPDACGFESSSGGTAVAVASNLAMAGTGSDTVNSIRSPASANALVGVRPTHGLLSLNGIMPVSSTQDAIGRVFHLLAQKGAASWILEGDILGCFDHTLRELRAAPTPTGPDVPALPLAHRF